MTKENIHNTTKIILIAAFIAILVPTLVLGYLGFVPGVSGILGANRPKDLGVKWTEQDLASASAKLGRTRETLPGTTPAGSLRFSGSHAVDESFSSEEVTATMQSRDYRYNPIGDDFQAKFNSDGTVEMSGTLKVSNFRGYAEAAKVPDDQADTIMGKLSFVKVNPSFYVKGTGRVVNNRLTYDVDKVQIGRVGVPVSAFPEGAVSRFVEDRIDSVPGLDVQSLEISGGKLAFKGTYPDKTYYETE